MRMSVLTREHGGFGGLALLALRLGLAGLFTLAAWVKLSEPIDFSDSVKAFKILPDHLAQVATFAVPWIELLCAACLAAGVWARASAGVIFSLLLVFMGGIASILWRGLSVNCGCFGKLQPFCTGPLGSCNIIQNAVLASGALAVVVWGAGLVSVDRFLAVPPAGGGGGGTGGTNSPE